MYSLNDEVFHFVNWGILSELEWEMAK